MKEETIVAIATAFGEGGIGIVRISGEDALTIGGKIFAPSNEKTIEARRLTYGQVHDDGMIIDEAMFCYMPAPHTYTTEDVVEIDCHGSVVSLQKVLALCLAKGARMAEPGEFTKRAFLGGRLDLAQAEAVIDLVKAKTDLGFGTALQQLDGVLSRSVRKIRDELTDILVQLTVEIDYPDEDVEVTTQEKLAVQIGQAKKKIDALVEGAADGRLVREGISIAINGAPNVGKSSLLNALLGEERAIVTEVPGTTRDTISEEIAIDGIPIRLTDTAGIRSTDDVVERIGIERSKESFDKADLLLIMIDASKPLKDDDRELLEKTIEKSALVLLNKSDLGQEITEAQIEEYLDTAKVIYTNMHDAGSIRDIKKAIKEQVTSGRVVQSESLLVTNARHAYLLQKASSQLGDALEMIRLAEPLELIEIDIDQSYNLLGEIIGETASADIIDEVFERFCLGK